MSARGFELSLGLADDSWTILTGLVDSLLDHTGELDRMVSEKRDGVHPDDLPAVLEAITATHVQIAAALNATRVCPNGVRSALHELP